MRAKDDSTIKIIALPFIGKGIGDAIVISGIIDTLVENGYKVLVIADKRTHFLFKEWTNIYKLFLYDPQNKSSLMIYPFKILVAPANNVDVWGPNYKEAVQVALSERRIMDADVTPIVDIIDREITKMN